MYLKLFVNKIRNEVKGMNYEVVNLEEKTIVGVTARTGNNDPQCQAVIGGLWQRFMGEGIEAGVRNKANAYCVGLYSDYDMKEMKYDTTVGVEVTGNANPELSVKIIPAGRYAKFHIEGDVVRDVAAAWNDIWKMPLERSFTADFEEYISNDNGAAQIDIYVALK